MASPPPIHDRGPSPDEAASLIRLDPKRGPRQPLEVLEATGGAWSFGAFCFTNLRSARMIVRSSVAGQRGRDRTWRRPSSSAWRSRLFLDALRGLDLRRAPELAVEPRHALDLALGGEALVEALGPQLAGELAPGREAPGPARQTSVDRVGVLGREVEADAQHGLDRHRARHHVAGAAPGVAPGLLGGFQEVAHDLVAAPGGDHRGVDLLLAAHPAADLVEELRLQDPLLLLRAAAQAVDLVAQRAAILRVELLHDARGELALRLGPGHALVQVHEVALVDARGRRVDDHEHLGGEVLALAVEHHAGDVQGLGLVRAVLLEEVERREPVLAVDHEEALARLLQVADVLELAQRVEAQLLGREQEHRARDRRLAHGRLVEILDGRDLRARDLALEGRVALLDLPDEDGHLVVAGDLLRLDAPVLGVEAADEADLREQVLCRVRDEVEDAVLLADLGRDHSSPPWSLGRRSYSRPARRSRDNGPTGGSSSVTVHRRSSPGAVGRSGSVAHDIARAARHAARASSAPATATNA